MRRLRYSVAMSLDGYIAGPNGEYDWIVTDPAIDFAALYRQFDAAVMGRKTFETAIQQGGSGEMPGMEVVVFSRTLRPQDHPKVTVLPGDPARVVAGMKDRPGKDIWLFGGGELFRSLAALGLVDRVEVAVVPVLLGGGTPMVPPPLPQTRLTLDGHRLYKKTGIMLLEYAVVRAR